MLVSVLSITECEPMSKSTCSMCIRRTNRKTLHRSMQSEPCMANAPVTIYNLIVTPHIKLVAEEVGVEPTSHLNSSSTALKAARPTGSDALPLTIVAKLAVLSHCQFSQIYGRQTRGIETTGNSFPATFLTRSESQKRVQ